MTNLDEARRLADAAEDAIREAYIDDGYPWSFSECLVLAHAFKELDAECERLRKENERIVAAHKGLLKAAEQRAEVAEAQLRAPAASEVEGFISAQHMGGEDRWALGYNAGVAKLVPMLRQLARAQKERK